MRDCAYMITGVQMRDLTKAFKALSDETRLRILNLLMERECCVCEVMQALEITQARASRNLSALYDAGFLKLRRDGLWALYSIDTEALKEYYVDMVEAVRKGLEQLAPLGIELTEDINTLAITGLNMSSLGKLKEPVIIDSRDDHRIAMAFGVLGAAIGGITITGAECVAKTYPGFWEALKSIGGRVEIYE